MDEVITIDDVPCLLSETRRLARHLLSNELNAHSIGPTDLVMSAIRRIKPTEKGWGELTWKNRHEFFGSMQHTMRCVLVDHARKRKAAKRPDLNYMAPSDLNFQNLSQAAESNPEQVEALELALQWLEGDSPELATLVKYRFFSGLTLEQTAQLMEVSAATVKRRWVRARLLLYRKVLEILNDRFG